MSGQKIIEALEEATRGDFARVTVAGHVWIRDGVDKAAAWDAVIAAHCDEREKCANIALAIDSGRGNERAIAEAIRDRSGGTAKGAAHD